ncbi:MAG: membrane dipeptidase [Gemmatimonadales bacterium]
MGLTALSEELLQLHHDAFVFDGHNDAAIRLLAGEDLSQRLEGGHLDLPRMREAGFDGGIFALWSDPASERPLEKALSDAARFAAFLQETPGMHLVLNAGDLAVAERAGDVAVLIGVEGAYGVERPDDVDRLYDVGVRCVTLTWMAHTSWADASGLEPRHGGLTREGRRILARIEKLGMMADISHAADATARDVLRVAERPPIASHSGVRRIADHHRNLPDDLLELLARREGVLGVVFFSGYLDAEFWLAASEIGARLENEGTETGSNPRSALAHAVSEEVTPVPFERLLAHFHHAISVVGPEHVGLGSDFDGVIALPEGLVDVRDLPKITSALAASGLSAGELSAVLGGNLRRAIESVLA